MNLKEFCSLFDYVNENVKFRSFRVAIDAAISIASIWETAYTADHEERERLLITENALFINPETGEARIERSGHSEPLDEQEAERFELVRFLPPEVICGRNFVNEYADRYTLGVLLFMFLTGGYHPLEGERAIAPVLNWELQKQLYGTEPLFLFDRDDTRNGPNRKIHQRAAAVWSILSEPLRTAFQETFGKAGLNRPSQRLSGREWIGRLIAFQNSITVCECGNILLLTDGKTTVCEMCGEKMDVPIWIDLQTCRIPAVYGNRIYECELQGESKGGKMNWPETIAGGSHVVKPIAKVIKGTTDVNKLGIRNVSGSEWTAVTTRGTERIVKNGETIPLKVGIRFRHQDHMIEIQSSNNDRPADKNSHVENDRSAGNGMK